MTTVDATQQLRILSTPDVQVHFESVELTIIEGPDKGLQAHLSLPTIRIGTAADNDLILSDSTVSRHHAEIRMTPIGLVLRDVGSTNGTFIHQLQVKEVVLEADTECVLGYSRLRIQLRMEERHVPLSQQDHLGALVGASVPMRALYSLLQAVAPTPVTVHITGESGSGKEVVARTLHELSGRRGPLVVFDASVTDPEMIRNDLFGHVKGAFTGATGPREGAFRRAHQGSLFIDEIGELPLSLQPRLLRVLESREVTPVGADQPCRVDVRVITATHCDLAAKVQDGTFRADLFYRLSVMPIRVPSLREISDDIPRLVAALSAQLGLRCRLSSAALTALQQYRWPGNVRELRNTLERAAVLCQDAVIQVADLHLPEVAVGKIAEPPTLPLESPLSIRTQMQELEQQLILDAVTRHPHNKAAAARELGIPLSTLKRRLKGYQGN